MICILNKIKNIIDDIAKVGSTTKIKFLVEMYQINPVEI
jgi:hypothetical protein